MRDHVLRVVAAAAALSMAGLASPAAAQDDLEYEEYRQIAETAHRLKHTAIFEPLAGETGMNLVVGDRFGTINVFHIGAGESNQRLWRSRPLSGSVEEILTGDLDGDGLDDGIVARTPDRIYVFAMSDFSLLYESLTNDFRVIHSFTIASIDDDPAAEIVINADRKIHYVDGVTFGRDWTSLQEYEATRILAGDVDGDGRADLVLNTGEVLDGGTGAVKWNDEVFGSRLELLDIDGDGVLEVLTESDGLPLRVFDIDYGSEKRFQ